MSNILYLTIVSDIKQMILKGNLKPGDILDSETTLIKKYNTTKMTIRKALSLLSNEGFIYSIPGKGNFVCKPQTNHYDLYFNKFDKLNVQIDEVKLISVNVKIVSPKIYIHLQLPAEEKVIEIRRILLSASKPIAYEIVYMKYKPQDPTVENIINFANYIQQIDYDYAFAIEKQLCIEAVKADDTEIRIKLKLADNDIIYNVYEDLKNTNDGQVVSYSIFSISTKYLTITAIQTHKENNQDIY